MKLLLGRLLQIFCLHSRQMEDVFKFIQVSQEWGGIGLKCFPSKFSANSSISEDKVKHEILELLVGLALFVWSSNTIQNLTDDLR